MTYELLGYALILFGAGGLAGSWAGYKAGYYDGEHDETDRRTLMARLERVTRARN
jgi:hypothetical protein